MLKFLVISVLLPSIYVFCQSVVDKDDSTLRVDKNKYEVNMLDQLEKRVT